jgi:trans-2-enoyl-CoA reductase
MSLKVLSGATANTLGQSRQRQLIDKRSLKRGKNITNIVSKFATQKGCVAKTGSGLEK